MLRRGLFSENHLHPKVELVITEARYINTCERLIHYLEMEVMRLEERNKALAFKLDDLKNPERTTQMEKERAMRKFVKARVKP